MTLTRFGGFRTAIAVGMAGLLTAGPVFAQSTPMGLGYSVNVGPLAVQLDITPPIARSVMTPGGGTTVVFASVFNLHIHDGTQQPAFDGDVFATATAADPTTLVGGLLPATLLFKQDLLAGMTFAQAAADAQAKTGVTVTFFKDVTALEYGLVASLIAVVIITAVTFLGATPALNGQACAVQGVLAQGMAAIGSPLPSSVALCAPSTIIQ